MKKGNAVFGFTLKNQQGETDSWYIDLKNTGDVAKGEAPAGKKADGEPPHLLTGSDPRKRGSSGPYHGQQKFGSTNWLMLIT